MLEKFILSLMVKAATDPTVRAFALELVEKLGNSLKEVLLPELLPKIVALLPVFGAGVIKEVFDRVGSLPNIDNLDDLAKGVAGKIISDDPDLPFLSDFVDISEILKGIFR